MTEFFVGRRYDDAIFSELHVTTCTINAMRIAVHKTELEPVV